MYQNLLKLNPDKSEFIPIGNLWHRKIIVSEFPISLNMHGNRLNPASYARNLGVTFDADLNFQCHVNNVVKSSNYLIQDLRRVWLMP